METALEKQATALLGAEYRLQPLPTDDLPRARVRAARPGSTPLDLTAGLAAALAAPQERASVVVLFIDGERTAIVSRRQLCDYFRARHADRLVDLLERATPPDSIATLRIGRSWEPSMAIVGALRITGGSTP